MAQDGKIRKEDLIASGAENIYKELADKAETNLKKLLKVLEELNKKQGKLGITNKKAIEIENEKAKTTAEATKELENIKIATAKATLEIKKQTLANKKNTTSQKKQSDSTKTLTIRFNELLRSMLAFIGVRMFIQTIKDTFTLIKKLDGLKFAMTAIVKTSKAFASNMAFLSRITKAYGAEIVSTTERYINFLAAAKQSHVTLKATQNIFETFTKVAGVLAKSSDDLRGIFLALEQMLSKGKVTTEELRRQLGERLPGAMGIMATSLGVTIPELDKMLKKGEVLSAVVLPEFAKQVEIAFGITNVTKVKTLTAANVRFKNKFVELVNEFKNGKGIIKTFIGVFDLLTRNLGDIISATLLAIKAFISYKVIMITNIALTKLMAIRTELLATQTAVAAAGVTKLKWAMLNLNKVLKANFIGIMVVAVTGLIFVMKKLSVSALKTSEAFIKQNEKFVRTTEKALQTKDSLLKMADAYDKLKEKGELSKDEQIEFNRILKAFGDNMPDVITSTDNYGVAVEANTTKLRENLKVQRELAVLRATQKNEDLEKQLKKLTKEYKNFNEETFQAGALTAEEEKKSLLLMTDKNNEFKLSIQNLKDQIKLNKDIISGQDIINKKTKEVQDLIQAQIDKNEKERLAKIRNIENLQNEIKVLVAKQKITKASDKETLDNITEQIKDKQKLIEIIKRSGKLEEKQKEFSDLSSKIHAKRIQSEINTNKEIINSDKTFYTEKIRLLEENKNKEVEINFLLTKDKIDRLEVSRKKEIENADKTGAKIADINKFYDQSITLEKESFSAKSIDIQTKNSKQIESIIKKEASTRQKSMRDRISIIDQTLKNELRANREALRDGRISVNEKVTLDRDAIKKANKEALDIVNSTFENIKRILLDAGLPVEQLTLLIDKLKEKYKELGDSAKSGLSQQDYTDILNFAGEAIGKIGDIIGNAHQAKIDMIEAEITAEEEKYARLKELAGDDADTQKALDDELSARKKELKEKERQEKIKQWKIDKKIKLAEIAISTAVAVMTNVKKGLWVVPAIIALGALEAGIVLSQPIPRFAKGGVMGYDGMAMINDGGSREYIERKGGIYSTDSKNAVVDLQKGDIIHKDINALLNANIMHSITNNVDSSLVGSIMKQNYSGLSGEIKKGFSGVKNQVNIRTQKIDLKRDLYRLKRMDWDA